MSCKAALQPKLYAPTLMLALEGAPYVDRSGNANHATGGAAGALRPDLRVGKKAIGNTTTLTVDRAAVQSAGELTLTMRAWVSEALGSAQAFFDCNGLIPTNGLYACGADPALRLYYAYETGENVGNYWLSNLTVPVGEWFFYSLRRAASGVVTLGFNQSYETSPALVPPDVRGSSPLHIGSSDVPSVPLRGAQADLCLWVGQRLTDAQLGPLYRAAMGQ